MVFLASIPWFIYALISAGFVGFKTILQKAELKKEHSLDYVVAFSLVAMLIALFLWPWVNFASLDSITLSYIYAASFFGSIAIWFGAKALRHLDISFISPQAVISTLFALLFAYLFLGEILTINQWLGVGILIFGGAMLLYSSMGSSHFFAFPAVLKVGDLFNKKNIIFYELLLLLAMLCMGLSTIFDKIVLERIDIATFIFVLGIFLFINHLIIYVIVVGKISKIPANVDKLGWLIVIIALLTVLSRLTYAQALSMADVSLVIPLKKSSILVSTILGGKVFKEKNLVQRTIIALLMLGGVWLLII